MRPTLSALKKNGQAIRNPPWGFLSSLALLRVEIAAFHLPNPPAPQSRGRQEWELVSVALPLFARRVPFSFRNPLRHLSIQTRSGLHQLECTPFKTWRKRNRRLRCYRSTLPYGARTFLTRSFLFPRLRNGRHERDHPATFDRRSIVKETDGFNLRHSVLL